MQAIGPPVMRQNSPSTMGLYVSIDRTANYNDVDMTTVTLVQVKITFPGGTSAVWSLSPVPAMTTASTVVAYRPYQTGDTAVVGMCTIVATPYVGSTPLPPAAPWMVPVKGPSLS